MFGASTNYPFNFANRNGIPNRAFRFLNGTGLILFRLNMVIPESAASLPILLASNNFTQPLTLVGGEAATGEQKLILTRTLSTL